MDNTKTYKALEDVEVKGNTVAEGETVDLNDRDAQELLQSGKIELVESEDEVA